MLLDEFNENDREIITPEMTIGEKASNFPAITISCFSDELLNSVLASLPHKEIVSISGANGLNPVYEIFYKEKRFAIYRSPVGEPNCIGDYEELLYHGSRCLILFGNCGVLKKSIDDCGIIIPTNALRDEGTSYHYAPASDSIPVNHKYISEFKEVLQEHGYDCTEGTTWTTDAFYRETAEKMERRKNQGAICVEMECAGMQALCDFRHTDLFTFFYAGDTLAHTIWNSRSLDNFTNVDTKTQIAYLAFELGLKIFSQYQQ
ncbi:MAG: nucleoside phosphorylase [Solobacterium sp.]|jgi:uridine phosphorylase|nr:nucleoside phosphorylase [Solobacterium sp.]MCH4205419.1 nucleoside phosphorylase [Solobacterium sp.]MCH4226631.1 nucleoside phosphorylase [Solobacterium sp.]MCH4282106.1 nucleoside phosphorylase [Solobacterium sp.]